MDKSFYQDTDYTEKEISQDKICGFIEYLVSKGDYKSLNLLTSFRSFVKKNNVRNLTDDEKLAFNIFKHVSINKYKNMSLFDGFIEYFRNH